MKRIETLKCNHPRLFWVSWGATLLWMVTVTINYASGYTLIFQYLLDDLGFLLLPTGMFFMFSSLDWREVENFAFFLHPGRLKQIGFDYLAMFILLCFFREFTEWLRNALIMLSLTKYLYDMIKLADMKKVEREKVIE